MSKHSFENVHRNKKLAFLDGLLCGLVIASLAFAFREDSLVDKIIFESPVDAPVPADTDTPV